MANRTALPPEEFIIALDSLKGQAFRSEMKVKQIPGPTRIAPWSVALQAEINDSEDLDPDFYRGDTKFVVLYDPEGQPAWDGCMRIVIYARAPMDNDIGTDELLGQVAWSWLVDSLEHRGASFHNLTGTVTRIVDETFHSADLELMRVSSEIRASWTPDTPYLTEHLMAWADFSCHLVGLDPKISGISAVPRKVHERE